MITLHFNNTTIDIQEDDNSYRYRSLMGEHNITLKFSLAEYIEFPIGAWCEYMAEKYTLETPANFKKNGTRDFEYTLIMESVQSQLGRYKLRNTVDKRLKFSMCATPKEFLQTIVDNLNQRDSGWSVGDCIVSTEKIIPFDHSYIDAALQSVADTFSTEWEIVGKVIHLHKVEYFKDEPLPLSYGKGNGFVPGLGRSTETDSRPIEIMFVQGGSRNIDRSKYGSAELLLPKSQTLEYEGRTYISDEEGYSIRRQDKPLKYKTEDSVDCSEIYPSRIGKVTKVEVVDEEKNFYDIFDDTIPESLDYSKYRIAGETATIIFQSGMLAGREFDLEQTENKLTGYVHSERRFKIVPQEIDGQTMPGGVYVPKEEDTYVIFGVMLPDAYVCDNETKTGASWDMFKEAAKHLYEHEDVKFTFTGELQGMWAKRNWLQVGGRLVVGGYVLFSDNQFAPDGVPIRITGIKDYITSPYSPIIELSNNVSGKSLSSTIEDIQNENVIVENNDKEIILFTKRRFRDAVETMKMLENALLDNFTNSITPITVQTMAMLVGDESLQFRFVDSSLHPIQYHITYNQETKQLIAPKTILQHMTLGIDTITSNRSKTEYKNWNIKGYTSPVLDQLSQQYYFYAKVPTGTGEGEFVLSPKAIGMDDVAGFYHLLVGLLNSEYDGERSFVTLYGFTEILPGRITTDKIVSADGTTYFDLANSVIGGRIKFRSLNGTEKDLSDFENEFNNQTADFIEAIGDLQSQIDGAIESFFYEYDPTTSNAPASSWKTDEDKNKHLNDTFTNLQSGRSWRWTKSGSTFKWTEITDTATTEALKKAGQAQDTANSKRRVFVSTPYPPYDIGDLWVNGTEMKRCMKARETGSYVVTDWEKAVNYDNTKTVIDGGLITSGTVQLAGDDTNIKAGITGEGNYDNSVRIWAGTSFDNRADAPFRVLQDGTVIMKKAQVEGIIIATSGKIGKFNIDDDGYLTSEYNGYFGTIISNASFMSWSQHGSSSFSNSGIISEEGESLANNAIYVTHNYDISGNDKIDNGINIVLREYGGFNGIRCKVDKSGGNGVAKALVLETTNPKDDVALEATGRVRFYNVRDIANEDAIYNLQLYARSIGNGNFELLAKQV
ncbi:hypothetical protein [Coprobacter fastidiosus]|jgi:hypothetical protein|uniref:hypothetical protein n=1 Tax=Coprobacter fastidiosus TaxID=1099853 RepID=UPI00241D232C|nr:hypothetical protein [Coprobacter fastidiosus]